MTKAEEVKARGGPVRHAIANGLPFCTFCHALNGDPCGTPYNTTTLPHDERWREWKNASEKR